MRVIGEESGNEEVMDDYQRPNYGIDAPRAVVLMLAVSFACFFFSLTPGLAPAAQGARAIVIVVGAGFLVEAVIFVWSSRVGKLRMRDLVLRMIQWRGDETVLDVGCGRGLLLVGAAKRLTTGRAFGVDIWRTGDQTGNRPQAAIGNAHSEGVAGVVQVGEGDARSLPFRKDAFDVILSSLAIHNVGSEDGMKRAIVEMVRVLKPGGTVVICDIMGWERYRKWFEESGMTELNSSNRVFLFMFYTRILAARKPIIN